MIEAGAEKDTPLHDEGRVEVDTCINEKVSHSPGRLQRGLATRLDSEIGSICVQKLHKHGKGCERQVSSGFDSQQQQKLRLVGGDFSS